MIHSYQKPLGGYSVGIVFGSFAPLHQGHLDLIYRAKKENDGGPIVIVCGFDGDTEADGWRTIWYVKNINNHFEEPELWRPDYRNMKGDILK